MGLVDGADVIMVYGMSLGVIDVFWWRYIASRLLEGQDRMLLLCMYFEPDMIMAEAGPDFIRDTNEQFRDVAYMGECEWASISERVIVSISDRVFDLAVDLSDPRYDAGYIAM